MRFSPIPRSKRARAAKASPTAAAKPQAATKAPTKPKAAQQPSKSILAALTDDALFGRMGFDEAPSWDPWLAFLEALQALPMSEAHLALYRQHTGRSEPPAKPARYAELVVGRRGGKSRILALIATYLACG